MCQISIQSAILRPRNVRFAACHSTPMSGMFYRMVYLFQSEHALRCAGIGRELMNCRTDFLNYIGPMTSHPKQVSHFTLYLC